jgi:hypothetical protein
MHERLKNDRYNVQPTAFTFRISSKHRVEGHPLAEDRSVKVARDLFSKRSSELNDNRQVENVDYIR